MSSSAYRAWFVLPNYRQYPERCREYICAISTIGTGVLVLVDETEPIPELQDYADRYGVEIVYVGGTRVRKWKRLWKLGRYVEREVMKSKSRTVIHDTFWAKLGAAVVSAGGLRRGVTFGIAFFFPSIQYFQHRGWRVGRDLTLKGWTMLPQALATVEQRLGCKFYVQIVGEKTFRYEMERLQQLFMEYGFSNP